MFDTNIFNAVVDGKFDIQSLIDRAEIYITHIQRDELKATPDGIKREQLLSILKIIEQPVSTESFVLGTSRLGQAKLGTNKVLPTETGIWDLSNWDEFKWGDGKGIYSTILNNLKKHKNNIKDALIAESAMINNLTLVTHDSDLFRVVTKLGGAASNLKGTFPHLPSSFKLVAKEKGK